MFVTSAGEAFLQFRTDQFKPSELHGRALIMHASSEKPVQYSDLGLLCQIAETVWLIKQPEHAALLYERLAPYTDLHAVGMVGDSWGAVSHYLGLLADLRADRARMLEQLSAAAATHTRWQLPVALAQTQAVLASTVTAAP